MSLWLKRCILRDSNPVRGDMFIEADTANISLAPLGAAREEVACYGRYIHTNICSCDLCGLYV